ncbi:hypothetical protein J6590_018549 [Homalodisca vitripennis]|nr:hypothetical protein J6590_018549 [Homalodisca vitripennis]
MCSLVNKSTGPGYQFTRLVVTKTIQLDISAQVRTGRRLFWRQWAPSLRSSCRQRTSSGLEKLPFYNHTECECQDKLDEVMPRDGNAVDYRQERNSEHSCKCPSEYTVRRLANGSCSCDCFDKQRDCIKYKKGKEYFNHSDRLCIEMGTCQLPSCDFGVYLRSSGRCPRKHEKFRTWSRYH